MDILLYLVCIVSGGIGVWLILKWGKLLGLLDKSNNRSSHEGVVPKGGGFGILVAFIFASIFLKMEIALWFPATILSLFSLLGDRTEISPTIRLPLQFIAAFVSLHLLSHIPCLDRPEIAPYVSLYHYNSYISGSFHVIYID